MLQEFRRLVLAFDSGTTEQTQFLLTSEHVHQPFIFQRLLIYQEGILPFTFQVFGCVSPPATPLEAINYGYTIVAPESQVNNFGYGVEKIEMFPKKVFPQLPICLVIVVDNPLQSSLRIFAIAELDVLGSALIPNDLFPPLPKQQTETEAKE